MCWVSHSSPLEHAWAHVHAQTINILQLDQRSPKAHSVKADHIWTPSCSWRLNPKGPPGPPAAPLGLKTEEVSLSYQIALFSFRKRASASGWSLCLVWHVCRKSWPLSSVLTATLVTTGTERLSCHSFVSSGSRITSHLSQDYSSDLLFTLKQMNVIRKNAAERSNSLLMFLNCLFSWVLGFLCFVFTLLAKIGINHAWEWIYLFWNSELTILMRFSGAAGFQELSW